MIKSKLLRALLFPPTPVLWLLTPAALLLLVYAMVQVGTESPLAIVSYVLSAYTLSVWCFRIPRIIRFFKAFRTSNPLARRWQEDERLRVNVSLSASLLWNLAYAALQLWLGVQHQSFWFCSLAAYYLLLGGMRLFLVRHTGAHRPGVRMKKELQAYRACGWSFLGINLALALMVFFMVYWNRTFAHDEITTIAMAAYTFGSFALAIVNIVKYRKYNSPVYSASKAIGLAAASVSILTLESTMLTTFGDGSMDPLSRKWMLGLSGAAIVAFIIIMAVYMIRRSTHALKKYTAKETEHGQQ